MFDERINNFAEVPIKDKDRKCTDIICTIFAAIFSLTLFILAFVLMNKENYYKTNYPTDSDQNPCSNGVNALYPFIYFPDINNQNTRVCVSKCPAAGDTQLTCSPNSKVPSCTITSIYASQVSFQRLGGFCAPLDPSGQQALMQTAGLNDKWNFLNTYDVIRISLLVALGIGIIWLVLVHLIPRIMSVAAVVLSILILVAAGLLVLFDQSSGYEGITFWKILIGILLLVAAILVAIELCFYRRRIKLIGIFLDWATKFVSERPVSLLYIILFIAFTLGLIVLCMFEYLAFLTHSDAQPSSGVYLTQTISPILLILVIIQFIWGLQFLKDSFNFVISGLSTQWYTNSDPGCCVTFSRLLRYHFGSVVGGSFLNAFFNVIDFVIESLRCYPDGACGACAPCCNSIFNCCAHFFDLIRTDVYSYINLTGIAECNAARNCQNLINSSPLFIGSQSVLYFYRISAYIFTVGLTVLLAYWMEKIKNSAISVNSLILIIIFSYLILAYFVDYHANAAEGIQISYLIEDSLAGGRELPADKYGFKNQISRMDKSYTDGKIW